MEQRIRIKRRRGEYTPRFTAPPKISDQTLLEAHETATRTERFRLLECGLCGATQLKRLHRNFWQRWLSRFFSIFPYRCRQCLEEQARLIPSPRLLVPGLVVAVLAGAYALVVHNYHVNLAERRAASIRARNNRGLTQIAAARMISTGRISQSIKFTDAERNQVLRNQDIVELNRKAKDRREVMQRIILSKAAYDLRPEAVAQLTKAGVSEELLSLMNLRMAQVAATGGDWVK